MWFLILMTSLLSQAQGPLEGNWVRPCQSGLIQFQAFRGNQNTAIDHFFQDANCRKPLMSFVNYGAYSLGSETIDYQFINVAVVLYAPEIVADYNRRAVCNITNWRPGLARVVTGRRCAFFRPNQFALVPKQGESRYGIWKVESNQLYFGRLDLNRPGTSPETRPQDWDLRAYFKQP